MKYRPKYGEKATKFVIKLKGRKPVIVDMLDELGINKFRLSNELSQQPGKYAYYAALYEDVDAAVRLLQSKLTDEIMDTLAARKIRATNAMVEAYLEDYPEWRRMQKTRSKLKVLKDALAQRAMILQNQASIIKRDTYQEREG